MNILGQKVPSGLHYRINLETGFKEAKILEEENKQTSLLSVKSNEDVQNNDKNVNPDVDIEAVRKKLEDALKNIPSEKFDDVSEEKWKDISKKFRSYKVKK